MYLSTSLKIVHAAFIVEFFHKCEEGFNQGLLIQSVYYTHMHIHCRYPDVHVLSENNSIYVPWYPNNGLSLHMSAKDTWLLNNVQFKLTFERYFSTARYNSFILVCG